ncbi:hypothetical protein [Streptomyces laurentii]|uniref:hypothetical protein n=1 Tax=Streptomyces laurentii TaxID=39478 RepID=UPI0033DEE1AA
MFTGTPDELRQTEEQARELATRAADLLTQLDALGIGQVSGQLHTPGGSIRRHPDRGWIVTDR